MAEEFPFLHRWARLKNAARSGKAGEAPPPATGSDPPPPSPAPAPLEGAMPPAEPPPLPPVESLTPDSDFSGFMRQDVDPGLRRAALRTLFSDERLYAMDGLDVYIDDYSKPDPIPEDWMGKLDQLTRLGHEPDPPPESQALPPSPSQTVPDMNEAAESSAGLAPTQVPQDHKPLDSEGDLPAAPDTPG